MSRRNFRDDAMALGFSRAQVMSDIREAESYGLRKSLFKENKRGHYLINSISFECSQVFAHVKNDEEWEHYTWHAWLPMRLLQKVLGKEDYA